MNDALVAAVRDHRVVLFVGSGVSKELGLPLWSELMEHMGSDLGFDPGVFASYDANFLTLAEYYKLSTGGLGRLRAWMEDKWKVESSMLARSSVHRLIVELGFPIVYTTNYDWLLEEAHQIHGRPFIKVANARDIVGITDGKTQIVKFHGDLDNDESIVLAETDYFDRLQFESPLDIKFRADTLGRPVLFIGYSLSDVNIRLLLHRLWRLWSSSGYKSERPELFVFTTRPNQVQEKVLGRWGITTVSEDADDPDQSLGLFLEKLKRLAFGA